MSGATDTVGEIDTFLVNFYPAKSLRNTVSKGRAPLRDWVCKGALNKRLARIQSLLDCLRGYSNLVHGRFQFVGSASELLRPIRHFIGFMNVDPRRILRTGHRFVIRHKSSL